MREAGLHQLSQQEFEQLIFTGCLQFVFLALHTMYPMYEVEVTMPILKLKVSYLLLAFVIDGVLALTLPYPGLPPLSLPLEQVVQDFEGLK